MPGPAGLRPRSGDRWAVDVIDFSGFNAVTTEPVPADPRAVMTSYWDRRTTSGKSATGC
jgi:hypothetical protein